MPSSATNRKTIRKAVAALIDTAFGATWDVFAYKTVENLSKARNIVVSSVGSMREMKAADQVTADSSFQFRVYVFVLYQDTGNSWTAENSEDEIDDTEKTLCDLFNGNQETSDWSRLTIVGMSDPDMIVDEGGRTFRREIITIRTDIYT